MIDAWYIAVDEIAGNENHVLQGEKAQKARFETVGGRELKKESRRQPRTVDVSWLTTARFITTLASTSMPQVYVFLQWYFWFPPPILDNLDAFETAMLVIWSTDWS